MPETNSRAVVLVHDRDPALGYRNIGTLIPELRQRRFQLQVHSFDYASAAEPPPLDAAAMVVVMGSPDAAYDPIPWIGPETAYLERAIGLDVPVLGICFGGQLLAQILGGTVTKSDRPEHGMTEIESDHPELVGNGPWMQFHGDTFIAPASATVIARNGAGQQAFTAGPHLGVQFHPEIDLDTFDSWAQAWERDGIDQDQQLVETIRADLTATEPAARARCSALLDAWIGRQSP